MKAISVKMTSLKYCVPSVRQRPLPAYVVISVPASLSWFYFLGDFCASFSPGAAFASCVTSVLTRLSQLCYSCVCSVISVSVLLCPAVLAVPLSVQKDERQRVQFTKMKHLTLFLQ
ncbi:hypothetical protein JZ751_013247, partial [Albula glossodonta]